MLTKNAKARIELYEEAIDEAKRFIKKAKKAIKRIEGYEYDYYSGVPLKEVASVKRSSMDLSRILTEVRK